MTIESFKLTGDNEPEKVESYRVTANLFQVLGTRPVAGRTFLPEDEGPDAKKVAIISYRLWQSRFGGERSIIGTDILLSGDKHTVIGVMPAGFQFLESYIGLWVPMNLTPRHWANRGGHYLTVVARMKPGVGIEQANADIKTIQAGIARDYPNEAAKMGADVIPL